MHYLKNEKGLLLIILICICISACSKMDDYKKYMEGGEITYTGKLDSVEIFSGRNRVEVTGLFLSDPNITKCKIYWNNKSDSITVPITRSSGVDTFKILIPGLQEGTTSFEIYTYDKYGNSSVPVTATGKIYGDVYESSLLNTPINSSTLSSGTDAIIKWGSINISGGVIGMQIKYKNTSGDTIKNFVTASDTLTTTTLPNFQAGTSFTYKTFYVPDSNCVDTFYSMQETVGVLADITNYYLKNSGSPVMIQQASWDGSRWGILADWTTTSPVINTTNGYGGYELRSGVGVISMEAGWGLPAITNGKIYQSFTLPSGKYSLSVNMGVYNTGGTRYMVVASGNELPDVNEVTSSPNTIGYTSIQTGSTINFTLKDQTEITVGFAATLPATGQYFKINAVHLFWVP